MEQARPLRLRYTLPALADLAAILDHIDQHSPVGAHRVKARIQGVIDLLPVHPNIGALTEDRTIRRMTTTPYPYLVFYEVTSEDVIIHAIRHGARDPAWMPGSKKKASVARTLRSLD